MSAQPTHQPPKRERDSAKANPAPGRQVAWDGGLWSIWSQAPEAGYWWCIPQDATARAALGSCLDGKVGVKHSQGCLALKTDWLNPPLPRYLARSTHQQDGLL